MARGLESLLMLELSGLDLDEIASALEDQGDDEHQWLIHSESGEIVHWTQDCGIDGQNPIEIDDLDEVLVPVRPEPSHVWYALHDVRAGRRAVAWLVDNSLVDETEAANFLTEHPDPDLP